MSWPPARQPASPENPPTRQPASPTGRRTIDSGPPTNLIVTAAVFRLRIHQAAQTDRAKGGEREEADETYGRVVLRKERERKGKGCVDDGNLLVCTVLTIQLHLPEGRHVQVGDATSAAQHRLLYMSLY